MKTFIQSALDILEKAVKNVGNQNKLAERTGVNPVTLNRWLSGARSPKLAEIGKIFDALGVTLAEPGIDSAEYAMIPKVEAKAGAGSSLVTDGSVQGYYAFRHPFLHRVGISSSKSVMMDVIGESMQPLIMPGDTILVDCSQIEPKDGGIFLVGFGEELLVKRMQRTPRGWLLISQNPDYEPIHAEGADVDGLRIYGRVRWFGRVV